VSTQVATSIKYDEVENNKQLLIPQWLKRSSEADKEKAGDETPTLPKSRKQKKIDELLAKEKLSTGDMLKLAALMKKQAEEDTSKKKEKLLVDNNFKFKIEANALKTDSVFWNESRPIPLTSDELVSLKKKDSVTLKFAVKDTLKKDSTQTKIKPSKVKPLQFLTEHTWRDSLNNEISFSGLVSPGPFWFNTVDGFGYGIKSKVLYKIDSSYTFNVDPQFGYAFSRKEIYWKAHIAMMYSPGKIGWLNIDFGHWSSDFNNSNGIKRGLNTLSSLFFRTNYMKLYDSRYLKIDNSIEVINGLVFKTKLNYDNRTELQNNSNFSFFYKNTRNYSSNIPFNDYAKNANTQNYIDFNAEAEIEYTPMMRYKYGTNKLKLYVGSDYPTFYLNVKKGIPGFLDSNSDFVFVSGGLSQQFNWGIASKFDYQVMAGGFPVKKNLHFADFYHVSTQRIPVLLTLPPVTFFSLLDYYKTSTPERFVEAHTNLSAAYLALKFLPLLNLTNLRENLSLGILYTPKNTGYAELGYGLSKLPLKGSLYYVAGFDKSGIVAQGFKLMFLFGNTIVIGGEE
jgi:acyl-CoA-binding protein